jgi:hypothetical protein
MTFTWPLKASHRRAQAAPSAASIGQSTGALLGAGGVAATGLVMVSTFPAQPRGLLAIAAHNRPRGRDRPGHARVRSRPET